MNSPAKALVQVLAWALLLQPLAAVGQACGAGPLAERECCCTAPDPGLTEVNEDSSCCSSAENQAPTPGTQPTLESERCGCQVAPSPPRGQFAPGPNSAGANAGEHALAWLARGVRISGATAARPLGPLYGTEPPGASAPVARAPRAARVPLFVSWLEGGGEALAALGILRL